MTSISLHNKPVIVLFAFLPQEAAFHKFNTSLLITFDPIARFRSIFFQTVCSHKAHPPKGFFKLPNCRCCAPQTKKPKILGKWGQKKGLVWDLFAKISKIVLKCFEHNKKLIQCHIRLIFFVVIALVYTFSKDASY